MQEAAARADRLSPQNLSNMLWGLATLGVEVDSATLDALAAAAAAKADTFEPQVGCRPWGAHTFDALWWRRADARLGFCCRGSCWTRCLPDHKHMHCTPP